MLSQERGSLSSIMPARLQKQHVKQHNVFFAVIESLKVPNHLTTPMCHGHQVTSVPCHLGTASLMEHQEIPQRRQPALGTGKHAKRKIKAPKQSRVAVGNGGASIKDIGTTPDLTRPGQDGEPDCHVASNLSNLSNLPIGGSVGCSDAVVDVEPPSGGGPCPSPSGRCL